MRQHRHIVVNDQFYIAHWQFNKNLLRRAMAFYLSRLRANSMKERSVFDDIDEAYVGVLTFEKFNSAIF